MPLSARHADQRAATACPAPCTCCSPCKCPHSIRGTHCACCPRGGALLAARALLSSPCRSAQPAQRAAQPAQPRAPAPVRVPASAAYTACAARTVNAAARCLQCTLLRPHPLPCAACARHAAQRAAQCAQTRASAPVHVQSSAASMHSRRSIISRRFTRCTRGGALLAARALLSSPCRSARATLPSALPCAPSLAHPLQSMRVPCAVLPHQPRTCLRCMRGAARCPRAPLLPRFRSPSAARDPSSAVASGKNSVRAASSRSSRMLPTRCATLAMLRSSGARPGAAAAARRLTPGWLRAHLPEPLPGR